MTKFSKAKSVAEIAAMAAKRAVAMPARYSAIAEGGNVRNRLDIVLTSHPVAGNQKLVGRNKEGVHVAKPLWHEIGEYAGAVEKIIGNYKGKSVTFRAWNYSDCDRHPDQKPGIITLGTLTKKMAVLKGLDIKVDEGVEKKVGEVLEKLKANFDLAENKENYKAVLAGYEDSIESLNNIWEENWEGVSKVWQGSDYRISGSDLNDEKTLTNIKETLAEIIESKAEIRRVIIADCEGADQIGVAMKLIDSMKFKDRPKLVPLFEDRVKLGVIREIIKQYLEIDTMQIAGSDSKRRIGYAGLLKLLMEIALEIEHSGRYIKIFVGSGNTHWRAEDLIALVPIEIDVERTVQGQLVFSLEDKNFAWNFLKEQQDNLRLRPSIAEAKDGFELFKKLDKLQQERAEATQNDPIFKKVPLDLILNNSKFFGSRHKPNKFPADSDSLSEKNLLSLTRAIEHAWIYKLTGAVSPEIMDLHNVLQNDEMREMLLAKKDNPYVIALIKSASKGAHYCDETVARKYYASDEICDENFRKLREVERFIHENFQEIEERSALVQKDLKWYEPQNEFAEAWQQFADFRETLANLVGDEQVKVDRQQVNRVLYDQYLQHPAHISRYTGRTFSTQSGAPKANNASIEKCLEEISNLFEESPAVRNFAPSKSFKKEGARIFRVMGGREINAGEEVKDELSR
ncbi:MAG: hypothetical protein K0R25_1239 [Rickettsiaceae bacterium]|jgi:hypothetical protein|nr:hypothetical protein [Rickettsiaceae bacterium]